MKKQIAAFVFVIWAYGCGGSSVREHQGTGGTAGASGSGASAGSGGSAGNSGSSGSAGTSGASGASGSAGSSGASGASGSDGSSGASGASGSTGSSGSSGSAGVSGAGGSGGQQCQEPGQCRLFSDCCFCVALGPGDPDPTSCASDCEQDRCSALGVSSATLRCAGGRCAVGYNCAGTVTCRSAPPVCEPGQVPSIVGTCWGPCVPAAQCASVRDCTVCMEQGQTCATTDSFGGPQNVCVPIPERCTNNPTCACMGESVCPSHTTCVDRSGIFGVYCSCPAC